MPTVLARILLFLSSYFPLALIFFVLWIEDYPVLAVQILVLGLGSLGTLIYYLKTMHRLSGRTIEVVGVTRRDNESMSYIVSYMIPFMGVASAAWQHQVALVVFFLMLGFLYVNSNMLQVNPTLNILGYHIYEVTLEGGTTQMLVSKQARLRRGTIVQVVDAGDEIVFDKRAMSN